MAIAPLIVRIATAGVAALGRAAAAVRAAAAAIGAAGRRAIAASPALARFAAALRGIGAHPAMARLVGVLRVIGTAVGSAARAVYGRLLPALRVLAGALRTVASLALRAAIIIGGPLRRALNAAARGARDLAGTIARNVLKWGSIGFLLLPLVKALGMLLPLVMLLAPAMFAAGAALAVLKLGFDGVGDALSAGLSGDTEEFGKALKKLAPSAQSFVKELVKIAPMWRWLKTQLQEKLFFGLGAEIAALNKTYFPVLTQWLGRVADHFGAFFRQVSQGLRSPERVAQIEKIFLGVSVFLHGAFEAAKALGRAFLDIAEVAAPSFGELGNHIGSIADRFAEWIRLMKDNGTLQRWLDTAKETFGQLMDIGREFGRVLGAIFKGTDEGGFLAGLKNSLSELADFLEGETGQSMIEFFSTVANAAAGLIKTIGDVVRWFQDGINKMRDILGTGKGEISAAFGAIGAAASGLFAIISAGVNAFSWIGGVVSRLGGLIGAVRGAASAINAALSSIRTSVVIDIITRRSEVQGYARAIGGGGGGGGVPKFRASGGSVRGGVGYVVGETGREMFVPNQNGHVVSRTSSSSGGVPLGSASSGLEALFEKYLLNRIRNGYLPLKVVGNRVVPA